MNWNQTKMGIDREYLRRSKEMSPGARLDWLAAALEFTREVERSRQVARKTKKK